MKVAIINWKTGQQAEKWGRKNNLPLSFCPHLFAFPGMVLPTLAPEDLAIANGPGPIALNRA